ncbi:MAG: hypothetical protein L3J00_01035 [Thiomicrorhabdus sp.]|nr:hypothetical protein [Thiomicrorhabdus sp.]
MKNTNNVILFLGDQDSSLLEWLKRREASVIYTSEKITADFIKRHDIQFLISYGYRYILKQDVLALLPDRAINLHISYLPWNRGADPNLWSFIENSPKGVTIHYLDAGVDTGDIIVQKRVQFNIHQETLATSYKKLHITIQKLFKQHWAMIKIGQCQRQQQMGQGSFYTSQEKDRLPYALTDVLHTPLSELNALSHHDI